ncbi:uracil phosphoribosyltransferase [Kordia sp. YSTF-M3]|uniref:Uracil phosphoribosyltransferase n=1 Tax=Kordia aestuariivivens TaxID=2759037 RepID=A0ABR7QCZ2_9FLAO|nr:uracil phosphoribosyltransferase [Kordia aestuariivivens]MBC8756393.1 uracil phosphoribosyltransferase [Kordia aestuariivivens]
MIIHDFTTQSSLMNQFIAELRDVTIQKDSMRFRRNIERVGEILSYECSKILANTIEIVETPLGTKEMTVPVKDVVICSILRAGLPLHQGVLNYFDTAENAFVSAYRDHIDDQDEFEIVVNYMATPSLEGKTLLLVDPMLATGRTMKSVYDVLLQQGTPKNIHIVSVLGSTQGVEYVQEHFPANTHLWIAAVDDQLNSRGYIIPGLGDAGDLAYGTKRS